MLHRQQKVSPTRHRTGAGGNSAHLIIVIFLVKLRCLVSVLAGSVVAFCHRLSWLAKVQQLRRVDLHCLYQDAPGWAAYLLGVQVRARPELPGTSQGGPAAFREVAEVSCQADRGQSQRIGSDPDAPARDPRHPSVNPRAARWRASPRSGPLIETGNVYLPHPLLAPWVKAFIEECAAFPNGAHDNQVDAMTQSLLR